MARRPELALVLLGLVALSCGEEQVGAPSDQEAEIVFIDVNWSPQLVSRLEEAQKNHHILTSVYATRDPVPQEWQATPNAAPRYNYARRFGAQISTAPVTTWIKTPLPAYVCVGAMVFTDARSGTNSRRTYYANSECTKVTSAAGPGERRPLLTIDSPAPSSAAIPE